MLCPLAHPAVLGGRMVKFRIKENAPPFRTAMETANASLPHAAAGPASAPGRLVLRKSCLVAQLSMYLHCPLTHVIRVMLPAVAAAGRAARSNRQCAVPDGTPEVHQRPAVRPCCTHGCCARHCSLVCVQLRFASAVAVSVEHVCMSATELFELVASVGGPHVVAIGITLEIDCACLRTLSHDA